MRLPPRAATTRVRHVEYAVALSVLPRLRERDRSRAMRRVRVIYARRREE